MFIFGHLGITLGIFHLARKIPGTTIPIDMKMVALGAMLPDLIDKPLGEIILAGSVANGRIIGHTLLLFFVIAIAGAYIWRKRQNLSLIIVSAAAFLHLLEDRMWETPQTFFWPLLGWEFPDRYSGTGGIGYFMEMFLRSYTPSSGSVFIAEVAGMAILAVMIYRSRDRTCL
jgi:membrane-bound metal-dependent hydrolase YbcI (DUF457 family)